MEPEKIHSPTIEWPDYAPVPNLFIAGFPRSGTTALGRFLSEHPDVFMPERRGMHYFGSDLVFPDLPERFDINLYAERFRQANREKVICETSVWYVYSKRAPREFLKANPRAKVIIMIRDPVETLYSLHARLCLMGNETVFDFKKALEMESDRKAGMNNPHPPPLGSPLFYKDAVKYADYLKPYFEAMGAEKVHVIIYDDFVNDIAAEYGKTLEFLGLDTGFVPSFQVVNPHRAARSGRLFKLTKNPPDWITTISRNPHLAPVFEKLKIKKVITRLNTTKSKRPPLKPDLEHELRQEFRPEVEKLGELLGRDLSHWSESKGK
ncbi:MAG: sulfotransferase [bacterium]